MPQPSAIPGPTTPPYLQLARWIRAPFPMMEDLHARYGDAFTLHLPALPRGFVILSDPLAVKDVFGMGPGEGHAGEANFILKPVLGEGSLLVLDGPEHLRQRKMIMPAFHGERMQAYGQTMLDMSNDAIDALPLGRSLSVLRPMQAITLQVILRTVFGVEEGPRLAELAGALRTMIDATASPILILRFLQKDLGPLSPWGRVVRRMKVASDMLRAEIRRGREKGTAGRNDVLAMMLDARDEAGEPLSESDVRDELVTLLAAGHETTATSLAWALRWLLPDPVLLAKLREEIASAGGTRRKIARLELLDATVKEALRLQPVVPMVGRVLKKDMRLGSMDFPAGSWVAPSIYLVHRRPSLYPEPRRFRPERFLGWKPAAWEFLPFGGGLRKCVGAAFAIYEMKMVLAALLPRVEMRLESDTVREARRGITIMPEGGLRVVVTARRSRQAGAGRARAA